MKWLAIANPAAGRVRDAERLLGRLADIPGVDVTIARTGCPGDATRLAREATGVDGVIAVGGDGTIAEILQGIDRDRHTLAVLPAGHGNCLARDLHVHRPGLALHALVRGESCALDLLEVSAGHEDGTTSRLLCASTVALGYVTEVVLFGRHRLAALNRAAYAGAAIVVVPTFFDARLASAVPAGTRRYAGLVINNTAHLANFRAFPDASPCDGRLDVMELGHPWPRQLLHNLAVLAGSRRFGPRALRQAADESVELDVPATLMIDGELLHDVRHVTVRCLPGAVRCVVGSP